MVQISFTASEDFRQVLDDLKVVFQLRNDSDVLQHSLRLSHILAQLATDEDIVTVADRENRVRKLSLPANVFHNLIRPNRALKDRHAGQRGFILANGPSTATQNLLPLADEIVISVNAGYFHNHYNQIRPRYHCIPAIHYNELATQSVYIDYMKEAHKNIGEAEIFLNASDNSFIKEHELFQGRTVHYIDMRTPMEPASDGKIFDLTKPVPAVTTVTIMCLMVAMYMGFKEIYLVGVEHSDWKTRKYVYPFELGATKGKDNSLDATGQPLQSNLEMFINMSRVWQQYRFLENLGRANGVKIFNATAGGELDEYERVDLRDVFHSGK